MYGNLMYLYVFMYLIMEVWKVYGYSMITV